MTRPDTRSLRLALALALVGLAPGFLVGCSDSASPSDGPGAAEAGLPDGGGADAGAPPADAAPAADAALDATPPVDGAPDAAPPADAAVACNTVPNGGATVTLVRVPQAPPAPTGGTIADGTYVLTSLVQYTGPGGASGPTSMMVRMSMRIGGGRLDLVQNTGSGDQTLTYDLATMPAMNLLTITPTCPSAGPPQPSLYSASPTELRAYGNGQTSSPLYVLTKQ
jgi:hypothetical protein